jgi:hypothetical protein
MVYDQTQSGVTYTHIFSLYNDYYWRVRAIGAIFTTNWSPVWMVIYDAVPFSEGSTVRLIPNASNVQNIKRAESSHVVYQASSGWYDYEVSDFVHTPLVFNIDYSALEANPHDVGIRDITERYALVEINIDIHHPESLYPPVVFRYDFQTEELLLVSKNAWGMIPSSWGIDMSDDGRFILYTAGNYSYPDDPDNVADLYLYDALTDQRTLISKNPPGIENDWGVDNYSANITMSKDGRYVIFLALLHISGMQTPLGTLYLYDHHTGEANPLLDADDNPIMLKRYTLRPALLISDDNRYLLFSEPSHLNGYYDYVVIYDLQTRQKELISVNSDGIVADYLSFPVDISLDNRFVLFESLANNLMDDDDDFDKDFFIRDRLAGDTVPIYGDSNHLQSLINNPYHGKPKISVDNRMIIFSSELPHYVPNDTVGTNDVFAYTRIPTIAPLDSPSTLSHPVTTSFVHTFAWTSITDATRYQIQIATDSDFLNIVYNATSILPTHTQNFLTTGNYYWRVRGQNSTGDGVWSDVFEFTIGVVANTLMDEQQLFNAMQPHLTNGLTFALFDVTANGIFTTLQFSDGAVVTGTIKLVVQNGLLLITVEGITGGNATQQATLRDTLPALIMTMLDETLPDDYLGIENVSMTTSAVNLGVVLPNP